MTGKPAPKKRAPGKARRARYHHGDLRRSLVAEAMRLLEEGGAEAVSVRAAAREAGVSPGAPFRHFPSRLALLAAVAEEALARLRAEIGAALASASDDPLERVRASGYAYLRWALRNPAHFEVISTRELFDLNEAEALRRANEALISVSREALGEAAAAGRLVDRDLKLLLVAGRAMVYGFARMRLDGHFPRWGLEEEDAEAMAQALVDFFIASIDREAAR